MKALKPTSAAILLTILLSISHILGFSNEANSVFFPGNSNSYIDFKELWKSNEFAKKNITVAAWVKWEDVTSNNQWANIITYNNPSDNGDTGSFWLQHDRNNTKFEFAVQTTSGRKYIQSTTKPVAGEWFHVTGVYDGSTIKIYINGLLESSSSHKGNLKHHKDYMLNIGRWSNEDDQHRFFNGHIIQASVWDTAFNDDQVNELMTNTYEMMDIFNESMLGFWHLNNINEQQVPDASRFEIHGTLNGGASFVYTDLPEAVITLPIELVSFTAVQNNQSVDLEWISASEINNDYYTLERSNDGVAWELIATLTGAGNSNELLTYNYTDYQPYEGVSYYRLTQTDYDGRYETFAPIGVNFVSGNENELKVSAINNSLYFQTEGEQLFIHDLSGRLLYNGPVKNGISVNSQVILVTVINANGTTQSTKIMLNQSNI